MGFPLVGSYLRSLKDLCSTNNHSSRDTLLLCACTQNPKEVRILSGRRVGEAQRTLSSAGFSAIVPVIPLLLLKPPSTVSIGLEEGFLLNYTFSASSEDKSSERRLVFSESAMLGSKGGSFFLGP